MIDRCLSEMNSLSCRSCVEWDLVSTPPEYFLPAQLVQMLCGIGPEGRRGEQVECDLLPHWFAGPSWANPAWYPPSFLKKGDRLPAFEVAELRVEKTRGWVGAKKILWHRRKRDRMSVSPDRGCDPRDFAREASTPGVTPHVAERKLASAVDWRTRNSKCSGVSQRRHRIVGEPPGPIETSGAPANYDTSRGRHQAQNVPTAHVSCFQRRAAQKPEKRGSPSHGTKRKPASRGLLIRDPRGARPRPGMFVIAATDRPPSRGGRYW
jgi:hypothetical protein